MGASDYINPSTWSADQSPVDLQLDTEEHNNTPIQVKTEEDPESVSSWEEEEGEVIDETEQKPRTFVDGGYGWVIVFSCCLQLLLSDGIINAFGVIYLEVIEKFEANSADAAWILATQTCVQGLVGPLVIFVMEVAGARITTIIGSLQIFLGILLSAFAPNVYFLYLTFGLIAGMGFGVFEQIGMSLVNLYFDKRSGIAMGIASAGTGAGIVIFSPLTNYLFSVYGYKVTCYILSAIALSGVVAGAVIVTPEKAKDITEKLRKKCCRKNDAKGSKDETSQSDYDTSAEKKSSDAEDGSPVAAISYSNSSLADSVTRSKASLVTEKAAIGSSVTPERKEPLSKKLCKKLKSACDFSLFRDYKFVLYTLAHILFTGTFLVPSGFMPARAVSYGISKTDASLLVSAMGIASLISRPICGLLIDIGPIKRNRFYLFIFWVTLSGALSLYSFGPTLEAQMTYAILYGIAQGNYNCMITPILRDLIGLEKLMAAYGLASLCLVIPTLAVPSASGYIFDVTGRYEYVYIFSGSVLLLAALCLVMILVVEAMKNRCGKQQSESKQN